VYRVRTWPRTMESDEHVDREQPLLDAIKSGDDDAMERLLSLHEESLFALCRGVLGHSEDAEDAVQETFMRALRSFAAFRGGSSVRTWLTRIAVNICLDWKRSHRPAASFGEDSLISHLTCASPETSVLQRQRIREALMTLLPRHRTMFLLKELEGWSVAEIAGAFHCTQRRVYHDLSTAHRALAEWRERCDREGE
jgi:RNA polymerase sigma-70 factor (ECF subfamily)